MILPPGVKHRSFTDSIESFINAAKREVSIILENGIMPGCDVRWHFLKTLSLGEIKQVRDYVFDYLREQDVVALALLEPTNDRRRNLTDRVHFHLLSEGGHRMSVHIRSLIRDACTSYGWVENEDYRMTRAIIHSPVSYLYYAFKGCPKYTQRLFRKGLYLQRLYTIGKWYKDKKTNLWNAIKRRCKEKSRYVVTAKMPADRRDEMTSNDHVYYAHSSEYEYGNDGLDAYYDEIQRAKEDAEMYDPDDYEDYTDSQPSEAAAGNAVEAHKPTEKLYRPKSVRIVKTAGIRRYRPVVRGRREAAKVNYYPRE